MVLLAALVTGGTTQHPVARGQGSKKSEKPGVVEISEGKDEKFRFFVRDDQGKLLAMSSPGGFESEKEARAAVETLKEVLKSAKVVNVKKDAKDAKDKK
jgi:hypothetical protein